MNNFWTIFIHISQAFFPSAIFLVGIEQMFFFFLFLSMAWGRLGIVTFRKLFLALVLLLPPFIGSTFHSKWTCLGPCFCAKTANSSSPVPHTQTYTLRGLASLSLRTSALLFCMFLMTFDFRYQSGAHWGLRDIPYCVCPSIAHTNPDKELEKLQEQIANSVKWIIDANLLLPLLSANETRFWAF